MTKDQAIALFCHIRCAHTARVSLAEYVAEEISRARKRHLKAESDAEQRKTDNAKRHAEWAWQRVLDLESLVVTYASFRGEHPEAKLPTLRDKEARCEAQIAEIAARLQDGVERAAWDALHVKGKVA